MIYLLGVDVILDHVGGPYLQRNLNSLAVDGRLFIIGCMEGMVTEVNLSCFLAKRLTVQGIGTASLSYSLVENSSLSFSFPSVLAIPDKPPLCLNITLFYLLGFRLYISTSNFDNCIP